MLQTFEKLIQIDAEKFKTRTDILLKNNKVFSESNSVSNLDLDPDFLNSVILHSDPGYLRLASQNKCRFYETILTDLLKSSEGKIKNILISYTEKETRHSSIISKKSFLEKVVNQVCPDTKNSIELFQVKTIQNALKSINFEIPSGADQCRRVHLEWLKNPKTPFICQIHEYIKEANLSQGDVSDLPQRKAVAKVLEDKMSLVQKDYIENLCSHLDDEKLFCEKFIDVSFWTKIASGYEKRIYAEDVCKKITKASNLSDAQFLTCLARMKREKDLCLFPGGSNSGLRPQPDCDQISTALNFSSFKASYMDCPGSSDQMIVTNVARIVNHFSPNNNVPPSGPCSTSSSNTLFNFNRQFDNDESWKLEACYTDRIVEREICKKTYFGNSKTDPAAYSSVVADILKKTRGADQSETCEMVSSKEYSPLLLKFKSGCFIIYDNDRCLISECKHKIIYNDRPIDLISIKGRVSTPYFALNLQEERFSQNYLITRDFKKNAKVLNSLSAITNFFKKSSNGLVHGVGCAEDLLPAFFKSKAINQCTPLPFILNGIIKEKDKVVFVTRTAADSLQAPRLLSWSTLFSGVKSYQRLHPLKTWTMYGLD